ncbi:MAG: hypothetical protein EBV50_04380 [Betaproteobacteria bacterium]|nr:hypothetical protein [Betaproteobacteria bacterium]
MAQIGKPIRCLPAPEKELARLMVRPAYEGRDLAPVNDLRGLLLAVLSEHWGIETERLRREVFPGLEKKLSLPTVLV